MKEACLSAGKNLTVLSGAAKTAAKVTAGAITAAVGTASTVALAAGNAGMEYQAQLSNVSTLLTGTEKEVAARTEEIGAQILRVSNKTGVFTDNLTDGMYQVISAFGDSEDAAGQLEIAAKAAAAGNAATADSINLLSAVTKGYGDTSVSAVQKTADLAFATVRLGQTSFPELAASMGKVIPLASALNLKQEQLFGAMSTLTGVTGSTAEVTTQLKATMQAFLSPSKNMQAALAAMGYESGKALLESKGLQGALDALKSSVQGDELAFAKMFSSVEAQTAVLAMAGAQSENLAAKTAEMYEASGAADTAFKRQTNNLKYTVQTIKNLGANILTQSGTEILPYAQEGLTYLAENILPEVSEKLGEIIPQLVEGAKWAVEHRGLILAIAAGVLTAVGAYKTYKVAVAGYNAAMGVYKIVTAASATGTFTLAGAMTALNIPVLAACAGIGLLVAGGVLLYKNWDTVKAKAGELGAAVSAGWSNIDAAVQNAIAAISARFPLLGAVMQGWWKSVGDAWVNIQAVFSNIISFIDNVFAGNWSAALENLIYIFGNLFGGLVNIAKSPINGVISVINSALGRINNISVTIPEWVPGMGGKTLGFNLPTIPMLATGGIVTAPTILEAGEGGEPEAILPLSKLSVMLQGVGRMPERPEASPAPDALIRAAEFAPALRGTEDGAEKMKSLPGLAITLQNASRIPPKLLNTGGGQDVPEEPPPNTLAPISRLAALLDSLLGKRPKGDGGPRTSPPEFIGNRDFPGDDSPRTPSPDFGGNWDFPDNHNPAPSGGSYSDGGSSGMTLVFNFYGKTGAAEAKEAARMGFEEFKRLYQQLRAEERRKSFRMN